MSKYIYTAPRIHLISVQGEFQKHLNLRALKFSLVNKMHIFQCMGNLFWEPLKFRKKYLTHSLKDIVLLKFDELLYLRARTCFWNAPRYGNDVDRSHLFSSRYYNANIRRYDDRRGNKK